ncbi:MAG: two-component response regulator [Chloroflexi bacterium]|nr:two-component response regulator [Chloroflexota bacterium]
MAEQILVVEDEAAVARGLQYALLQEGWGVTLARSGEEALAKIEDRAPDLAILDVRLPGMSGFDLCREIRRSRTIPILMLTARVEEIDKVLGLELGADDYMSKPFSVRELVSRVRALLRRAYGTLASTDGRQSQLHAGNLRIDLERRRVFKGERRIDLTATEFELLAYLARHPGIVFTRDQLLRQVWDYDNFVGDEKTVNVHIRHLREKIEDQPDDPAHIITVRGVGYKFAG